MAISLFSCTNETNREPKDVPGFCRVTRRSWKEEKPLYKTRGELATHRGYVCRLFRVPSSSLDDPRRRVHVPPDPTFDFSSALLGALMYWITVSLGYTATGSPAGHSIHTTRPSPHYCFWMVALSHIGLVKRAETKSEPRFFAEEAFLSAAAALSLGPHPIRARP